MKGLYRCLRIYGRLAPVKFRDTQTYGYIDTNGNTVIPARFDIASIFRDGLAVYVEGEVRGHYRFIDREGTLQ